jgi:hypothetical protein
MSTTREKLHILVEQVPADKVERVLTLLQSRLDPPPPESELPRYEELMRERWKQVGDRIGLDVDQLPKNGSMSGGVSGDRVEVTKDWVSGDARHRLSSLGVQGHEIILLERMTASEGAGLRYEVLVFTAEAQGLAEVHLRLSD